RQLGGNAVPPGAQGQPPAQGRPDGRQSRPGARASQDGTQRPGGTQQQGAGGLLDAATPGEELVALLRADAASYRWVAAAVGANNAAGYQLATERPVMAIGGFNGSDAAPSLAEFQRYLANGDVHYFLGGGTGLRAGSGSDYAQQITAWVQETYPAVTVDGVALYDLTRPSTG
ncbi:MAG: glycosyl transferase, partial [Dactylosporangium sp.]|nr:glycosyl transferase [Dactylosporangium sp.]NNJ59395.1 glycosyl transferase [Dactylosporangium sp.]